MGTPLSKSRQTVWRVALKHCSIQHELRPAWLEIGKQLAEAQDPPRIHHHFIQLAEVQRGSFRRGIIGQAEQNPHSPG
jgi:hypothetical protein